jgi:hypothetical protein
MRVDPAERAVQEFESYVRDRLRQEFLDTIHDLPTPKFGAFAKQVVRYSWGRRESTLTWCANKTRSPLSPDEFET